MSDLKGVLTPEQMNIRRGMYASVSLLCWALVNLCMITACCLRYPLLGKITAFLCVSAALVLVGFEVGRRFERRAE